MKVVLTNPPHPEKGYYRAYYPSLGLLYLASYLEKHYAIGNLSVDYIEGSAYDPKGFLDRISRLNPDVIGLTFATSTSSMAYSMINLLKERLPNSLIVCGGPHVTALPADVLQRSKSDVCVIGEGEVTFLKLVEAYERKTLISNIDGIAVRQGRQVVQSSVRPLIADLDSIPFPAWEKINIRNYQGYMWQREWPDMCYMSTRGCPFNCVFCANPVWKVTKPWIRMRSPENIAKEVNYLANLGVKELYDYADEFNASEAWANKVAEKIANLHQDLIFKTQLRADRITEKLASSLSKMGCWMAHVGIESGNQEVMDGINKELSINQVVKGLKLLKKYDIKTLGFFMIFNVWEDNGLLKFETPQMCEKTLRFARQLLSAGLLDYISWSMATPVPGSKLYDLSLKYNLIDETKSYSDYVTEKMVMSLPGVSKRDMSKIKFEGMCLQLYNNVLHRNINMKDRQIVMQKIRTIADHGLNYLLSR